VQVLGGPNICQLPYAPTFPELLQCAQPFGVGLITLSTDGACKYDTAW